MLKSVVKQYEKLANCPICNALPVYMGDHVSPHCTLLSATTCVRDQYPRLARKGDVHLVRCKIISVAQSDGTSKSPHCGLFADIGRAQDVDDVHIFGRSLLHVIAKANRNFGIGVDHRAWIMRNRISELG